jgi:hypothetical protein
LRLGCKNLAVDPLILNQHLSELDVVGNGGNLSYGRTYPSGGNDWSKTSFDKNLNIIFKIVKPVVKT